MGLTLQTAQQAGVYAQELLQLQTALASAQAALAAGATLQQHGATAIISGTPEALTCEYPLNASDSATILNALIAIYQNNINAITATLASM